MELCALLVSLLLAISSATLLIHTCMQISIQLLGLEQGDVLYPVPGPCLQEPRPTQVTPGPAQAPFYLSIKRMFRGREGWRSSPLYHICKLEVVDLPK